MMLSESHMVVESLHPLSLQFTIDHTTKMVLEDIQYNSIMMIHQHVSFLTIAVFFCLTAFLGTLISFSAWVRCLLLYSDQRSLQDGPVKSSFKKVQLPILCPSVLYTYLQSTSLIRGCNTSGSTVQRLLGTIVVKEGKYHSCYISMALVINH